MQPGVSKTIGNARAFAIRWLRCGSLAKAALCLLFTTAIAAVVGPFASFTAAAPPGQIANEEELNSSVKPGDDFYRYCNGTWLSSVKIPEGQASYDTRSILAEKTGQRVRDLVQEAASSHAASGSVEQKVGDYYASFIDENGIEAKGLTPLGTQLAMISAITDKASLSAYLGTTLNVEIDGLVANSDHVFGVWVNQGFEDSEHNLPHLLQGGLGMTDRDSYIDASPKAAELRARYQAHIAAMLKLEGVAESDACAAHILWLEIRMAQAFAPDSDAADVFKQNNSWKRVDFPLNAPGIDWNAYFKSAGLDQQSDFTVWQPSAVIGVSALVNSEPIEYWKDYFRFHLIEHYAWILPKVVTAEHFAFYAEQKLDRVKLAIAATNGALGQAVGQLYTHRYFSPEAKVKAQAMVTNMIAAYRTRISNLTWLSATTRNRALNKLEALEVEIGYPDRWIDYSSLDIVRGDAFGNAQRAEAFLRSRSLAKLRETVDPIDWPINPQVPGAVIMFSPNAEFFSAAILQPPYFDPEGDSASNYGSAGAGIAHEISHSFDELGNIYGAHGQLGDWWTQDDRAKYHAASAKLAAQFDRYCPLPDACVNGKQVLNENIADLAGLLVAHDAYIQSLKGKTDVVKAGLSGEQRFFIAFAQRWRKLQTQAALRRQITTDTHPPGEYRSDTVRNVEAWYKAFGIVPSDHLYVKPEDRVQIW